jgi:PD-(D/E)XK nuclease superfamily
LRDPFCGSAALREILCPLREILCPLREILSKIEVQPMLTENEVAATIVDVAYHIHRQLGPGLLESVYHAIMKYELEKRGLRVLS